MKIIVLGGGYCQINMLQRLKELGHYIILVDYLEDNPGKVYADIHEKESTFDEEVVTKIAIKHNADAIITMGTDQPVLTASITADKTDIPFYIKPEVALSVTNKMVMKDLFVKNNIPTVKYKFLKRNFRDEDVADIDFPAVIKPLDSQGQRGIFKVSNISEIRENIDETFMFTRQDKILLEEYYPNDEITINGWVKDGKTKIISVVDRVTMENENRIGICIAHNYPSLHYQRYKSEIKKITEKIVDVVGIKNGPIYFQYLIGENGILVNEIAARIGGAYEDIAIPIYCDIDILGLVFDNVLSQKREFQVLDSYNLVENKKHLMVQMFFIKPGKIDYATPINDVLKMDGVKAALYLFKEGSDSKKIKNATARAGYFIVEGNSYKDVMKKSDAVFEKIQIGDNQKGNLLIKYSDYKNKYKFV